MDTTKNTKFVTLISVLVLSVIGIVSVVAYNNLQDDDSDSSTTAKNSSSMQSSDLADNSVSVQTGDLDPMTSSEQNSEESVSSITISTAGLYTDYDDSLLSNAEDGKVVLFFSASWCPTCQLTDKNLGEEIDKIPAEVTILSVDYDENTDLRRKYGVTYQHTFVEVDADGNELNQASGLSDLSDILDFLEV